MPNSASFSMVTTHDEGSDHERSSSSCDMDLSISLFIRFLSRYHRSMSELSLAMRHVDSLSVPESVSIYGVVIAMPIEWAWRSSGVSGEYKISLSGFFIFGRVSLWCE